MLKADMEYWRITSRKAPAIHLATPSANRTLCNRPIRPPAIKVKSAGHRLCSACADIALQVV